MSARVRTDARLPLWLAGISPLVAVAALLVVFFTLDPIASLREVPPTEAIAVERTKFRPGEIELRLRNDGPDRVTVAQVLVNDAYWQSEMGDRTLDRLEARTLTVTYPWQEGLPVEVVLLTATGTTIVHEVEVATLTPEPDRRTVVVYALLGLYMGVAPVAIGLLWFGTIRRVSARSLGFFLAFTVGLLTFLLVDTVEEGVELAGRTAVSFDGLALFAIGALGAAIALSAIESSSGQTRSHGLVAAYLVAIGVGLHNLGEGLAVGSAIAVGELALGRTLVVGFALHNTTEGLAIVSPLGTIGLPRLWHLAALGAIAGAPTIVGAWVGGFVFHAAWATLAFGVAAGAIAQVMWTVAGTLPDRRALIRGLGGVGFMLGLGFMYATGLLTP